MEEMDLKALVEKFKDKQFSLMERLILSNDGTNVTLLSVIFQTPIQVRVVDQIEHPDRIVRLVYLETENLVVGKARSTILVGSVPGGNTPANSPEVLGLVREKALGLGHIATRLGIRTERTLVSFGADELSFWRTYQMVGEGLWYQIQEWFPRAIYNGVMAAWKWPRETGGA
ncbi:MAG: hypothetical protein Q8O40_11345 [Chloroflexota bacterium]|nr:hypothetical protein [Chloroflexota bacterium]